MTAAPSLAQQTDRATRQDEPAGPPSVQEDDQPFRGEAGGPVDSASVIFDGHVLFVVAGIPGFEASERAGEIRGRIVRMARDRTFDLTDLRTREAELGTEILAGDDLLLLVADIDARLVGVPQRSALARRYADRIGQAAGRYRADREPRVLLINALYALAATLGLALALYALRWLYRRSAILERRYRERVRELSAKSKYIIRIEHIRHLLSIVLRAAFGFAALLVTYIYLNGVLGLFPWTRGFARELLRHVLHPLETIALGFVGFIPNLLFIVILAIVTRLFLGGLKAFLAGVAEGRVQLRGFEADWAWPTYRLLRILVVAFFVVVAYPYIPGSESAAFKGVSIFLGVVFSLGSSSVIGNLIAGYSMTYRRTFKVGDRVQIADMVGDVSDIRLLVTHLRSPKNEEIVVPNSLIIGSNVINYSSIARREGLILHTTVGIGYEVPWRQVEAMLLEAASRTEGLNSEPPPFVLQKELADFCVTYELNAYCQQPRDMYPLYSELHRNIQDVFNEHGVQIMTPAYVADPDQPKLVPRDRWFEPPATPAQSDAQPGIGPTP